MIRTLTAAAAVNGVRALTHAFPGTSFSSTTQLPFLNLIRHLSTYPNASSMTIRRFNPGTDGRAFGELIKGDEERIRSYMPIDDYRRTPSHSTDQHFGLTDEPLSVHQPGYPDSHVLTVINPKGEMVGMTYAEIASKSNPMEPIPSELFAGTGCTADNTRLHACELVKTEDVAQAEVLAQKLMQAQIATAKADGFQGVVFEIDSKNENRLTTLAGNSVNVKMHEDGDRRWALVHW